MGHGIQTFTNNTCFEFGNHHVYSLKSSNRNNRCIESQLEKPDFNLQYSLATPGFALFATGTCLTFTAHGADRRGCDAALVLLSLGLRSVMDFPEMIVWGDL